MDTNPSEESPGCREQGCLMKVREIRFGGSTVQNRRTGNRVRATVTNAVVRHGVKRAILPAAISDSAVTRLLAKAGSREPSQRRRCDQSSGLREMTI